MRWLLVIRRGGWEYEIRTELVSMGSLIESQWIPSSAGSVRVIPATLRRDEAMGSRHEAMGGRRAPYLIGIHLSSKEAGQVVVDAVLRGSPAAKADIKPGDMIVGWAGNPLRTRDPKVLNEMMSGDHAFQVQLRIRQATVVRDISLMSAGITEVLRESARHSPVNSASTSD